MTLLICVYLTFIILPPDLLLMKSTQWFSIHSLNIYLGNKNKGRGTFCPGYRDKWQSYSLNKIQTLPQEKALPDKPALNAYRNYVTMIMVLQSCNKQYNRMEMSMCVRVQHPHVLSEAWNLRARHRATRPACVPAVARLNHLHIAGGCSVLWWVSEPEE